MLVATVDGQIRERSMREPKRHNLNIEEIQLNMKAQEHARQTA
jgi:hypothetical protein